MVSEIERDLLRIDAPDARVELIEGEVIQMAPMKSRHAGVVARLSASLQHAAGDKALM